MNNIQLSHLSNLEPHGMGASIPWSSKIPGYMIMKSYVSELRSYSNMPKFHTVKIYVREKVEFHKL